jgi:hypothetical protein
VFILDLFTENGALHECRYAASVNAVPVLITHSQEDWHKAEEFSYASVEKLIGHLPVRKNETGCAKGSPMRDTSSCHTVKELDTRLLGRAWAALTQTNLTELGVETYSDLMRVQVCAAFEIHVSFRSGR